MFHVINILKKYEHIWKMNRLMEWTITFYVFSDINRL